MRGCRDCERMVVGLTTTYAIGADHHYVVGSTPTWGEEYNIK